MYKPLSIGPFNGLNQDENPHALKDNDLITALNVVRRGSTVGTRPGTTREGSGLEYENALTGANPVQGIFEHRENFGTGRHLLVVSSTDGVDGNVFYEDASVLPDSATIADGQDLLWTFTTHNNITYAAGGDATDDFWYWAGDTGVAPAAVGALDSAPATLRPQYVFAWRNYLLINGLRGGILADNNPSATRYCDVTTDPTNPANWGTGNTIGFNAFGRSYTTGLGSYRDNDGDFLLILNNDHIDSVILDATATFVINDAIATGCVGQRAFVDLGLDMGDAIYMSDQGIHSLRQSQQYGAKEKEFISWKIRPLLETANNSRKKYTVGAYDFINGRVVFAISTGSNTAHDTLLCLDMKDRRTVTAESADWSVWRMSGFSINELKMCRDQSDIWRLYFGTTTGDIGYFSEDIFSDLGSAYSVKIQTKHNDYGSTMFSKTIGTVTPTINPGGSYTPTLKVHFDYGQRSSVSHPIVMPAASGGVFGTGLFGTAVFGSASVTRNDKIYAAGSGRTISFSIEHSGGNEPFWISKIDHEIDISGEDTADVAA